MEHLPEKQVPAEQPQATPDSFKLRDCARWFIGMTVGNVIGDHLFHLEFSDASAVPRAAIATGLIYGGHKIREKIKG